MRSMKFAVAASVALTFLLPTQTFSQSSVPNLTGVWRATGYQCPTGTVINSEQLLIIQVGENLTAVKTNGDPCVPSGYPSFFGRITGTSSQVTTILGNPSSPGSSTGSTTLNFVNPRTLTTSSGLTLKKL